MNIPASRFPNAPPVILAPVTKPTIAIFGAGRLGSALAKQLAGSGYGIREIVFHRNQARARRLARQVKARASAPERARLNVKLVWFCVPDGVIADCAASLGKTNWRDKIAFHSSGVFASDALRVLARQGAKVASVHPLMTFVRDSSPDLGGVAFALEGDPDALRVASKIVHDLGGKVLSLRKTDKVAYHAFATMICPLLVSLAAAAEAIAAQAGLAGREARRLAMPMMEQTLVNYQTLGPAASFTGPIARGDAETIRRHLKVLAKAPAAKRAYLALAQAALEYLPSANTRELRTLLNQASSQRAGRSARGTNLASRRATHPS